MGTILYHLDFDAGGSEQNTDFDYLKGVRDNGRPGRIKALDLTYRVDNDPYQDVFNTEYEAEQRQQELSGMYVISPIKVLISPQPPGLND